MTMQERNVHEIGYSNSKVIEARSRSPAKRYAATNTSGVDRFQSTAAATTYGRALG